MTTGKLTYGMVRDGIVTGRLSRTLLTCQICGQRTCGIEVGRYDLPQGVTWTATIIAMKDCHPWDRRLVVHLGIGCGCYAKFHRQVLAHIVDSVEGGRGFPQT